MFEPGALARGVVLVKLPRTTPQERVIHKCKLTKTFVTVMGEASLRPVFHGFTRPRPDATSMVTTTDAGHGDAGDGDDHATAAAAAVAAAA